MQADAASSLADARFRMPSEEERAAAFRRAARHSALVGVLRKALPALAVLTLGLYLVSSKLTFTIGGMEASVGRVELRPDSLRMVNPKLEGADKKNGSYLITADYADQDVKSPSQIQLSGIKAEMNNVTRDWSRLSAEKGLYDTKAETLTIENDIRVATSSGMSGLLQRAAIDMKSQTLRSDAPVAFEMINGTVRAATMELRSADRVLTFRGNVRVHIKKQPAKAEKKTAGKIKP